MYVCVHMQQACGRVAARDTAQSKKGMAGLGAGPSMQAGSLDLGGTLAALPCVGTPVLSALARALPPAMTRGSLPCCCNWRPPIPSACCSLGVGEPAQGRVLELRACVHLFNNLAAPQRAHAVSQWGPEFLHSTHTHTHTLTHTQTHAHTHARMRTRSLAHRVGTFEEPSNVPWYGAAEIVDVWLKPLLEEAY